ncbi:hypothetical protein AVEN_165319-1 [Araneus ventricosus]|uniref:Uncharacterized protein n=1 Tax=Araneus ventricosus TaxID=182803 RepID=A0A4Y2AVG9_ARAVE|nr:hypothetical protein AVEN_165319-1 [Araneus ventricosus]
MIRTDFKRKFIPKHLLAHVSLQCTSLHISSNILEASGCPFQKGFWLAAYPFQNSLDDSVVVCKQNTLQHVALTPHGSRRGIFLHTVGVCGEFQTTEHFLHRGI